MHKKPHTPFRFYTLACPDCGQPLIEYAEDGTECLLSFRSRELAEMEAEEIATEDGEPKPEVVEVELTAIKS